MLGRGAERASYAKRETDRAPVKEERAYLHTAEFQETPALASSILYRGYLDGYHTYKIYTYPFSASCLSARVHPPTALM